MTGTVLVACDKFKGSLTGRQATAATTDTVAAGGRVVQALPVAAGGDGTLDTVEELGFRPVPVEVSGPAGEPVITLYAVRDGTAVHADELGLAGVYPLTNLEPDPAESMRRADELLRSMTRVVAEQWL